jgi:hypothetical protein
MRFASSIIAASAFVVLSSSAALAQSTQEKITLRELPAAAALAPSPSLKSNAEAGIFVSSAKKRVSPETEKQYLQSHPEGAYILPADTQERIKAGLPVQVIKVNPNDLTTISGAAKK